MPGGGCGPCWETPVTDDHDRIHELLNAAVQPLPPPPGTFQRIRRRARRRRAQRAALTAAAAAAVVVVIAGAVAAPGLVARLHPASRAVQRTAAASVSPEPAVTAHASSRAVPGSAASRSATRIPASSALSATTSGEAAPASFRPTSVTIVGTGTGGLVGAVIGQAGTSGHCASRYCTSLAGTSDFGTWYGVSAPPASGPDGARGVSQLRFLSLADGWAFGPQLWATTDGGRSWQRQQTHGLRITALEAAGDRAFAIFAKCSGSGPATQRTAPASRCTHRSPDPAAGPR